MKRRRIAIFPIIAAGLGTVGLILLALSQTSREIGALGLLIASVTVAVLSLRED